MWEYFQKPERCWRCGKPIDPSACERHCLIPSKFGGRRDRDNVAKLDYWCSVLVQRMTQDVDKSQLTDGKNPFVCTTCGTVGEVVRVQEKRESLSLALRCRECRSAFAAAFSSKMNDPRAGTMSSI
ncbi:MAG TPA: hypothetical protein DCY61_01740 [Dehalococcoidia bacterium]|nr:hypothetical protein [Dehalococcoidia bacterium]